MSMALKVGATQSSSTWQLRHTNDEMRALRQVLLGSDAEDLIMPAARLLHLPDPDDLER